MAFERFIAQRYIRSRRELRFINIIMVVSVTGITVGVAALIIVLSVFNGFNGVVTSVLVGFDPHIRITPATGKSFPLTDSLAFDLNDDARIEAWAPYVSSKALLVVGQRNRVVFMKGVDDSTISGVSGVKKSTLLGEFKFNDQPGQSGIVLGLALADRLGVTVGSELSIVSPVGVDAMLLQFGQPKSRKCSVVGIYDSNNKEYDAQYAFISLGTARDLFNLPEQEGGIEIRLHDIEEAQNVQRSLSRKLGPAYVVASWYDLHRDLYTVMRVERWTAYIILCLIIGVATFNMLGSLTMGVIEKRRDIGVLKAIGATKRSIIQIFMYEGLLVGFLGTMLGMVIGAVVCYIQIHYQVFPLDPTVYIIPALPVDVQASDFWAVGIASMLLSTVASFYPALRAARMIPIEAIRWE